MSIRLRLTLLYSAILALTLIVFNLLLYVSLDQITMGHLRRALAGGAELFIQGHLPSQSLGQILQTGGPPDIRVFAQIRSLEGQVLERSSNLDRSLTLPLSQAGLQAAQQGQTWVEIGRNETGRLLIHTQAFTSSETDTRRILQLAVSLANRDRDMRLLARLLLTGSSLVVFAAFGVGWVLAGLALRPINRLTQTAQAIGAERDFDRRVDYAGPNDEIGRLVTTFNNMLAELQTAYQHMADTLQAQRRFASDASHELRTPLTTLRGNLGLLQRQPPISAEDRADVLGDMVDETERLMRLVNELLLLARTEAGQPFPQEPVPLRPLLREVYQEAKSLSPHRPIINRSDLEVTLLANNDALKQILLILLDNALKYTPPEATITLTTALQAGQVAIMVSDNGPGIAPEHLPYIFERFYRGDTARASSGTGLGLAIARELAQAQHGSLAVDSQPGRGTTFTLTLAQYSPAI